MEDVISGAEIAPCLPALAMAYLPLCLQWGEGPVSSPLALLWYSLNLSFCERTRLLVRLESFIGTSFFFFFFFSPSLAIPPFGLLSHVSSLRLSSGHSSPVLSLRTNDAACTSLSSPCSLMVDMNIWATSPLGVVIRHVLCGYFFFFSSRLCCPLRFQNCP